MENIPNKSELNDIIEQMGLPPHTKWVGYSVHIPSSDEFLAGLKNNKIGVFYVYSDNPADAKAWQSSARALRERDAMRERYPDAELVILLDTGEQIAVMNQINEQFDGV